MRTLVCLAVGLLLTSVASAQNGKPPRNLALELTLIRFKPDSKEQVLQDFRLSGGASNAVETLRKAGRSVDVLYRGTRELAIEPKATAKFDATETRPVVLVGAPGAPVPPATLYGVTLAVSVRPTDDETFVLSWEGSLNWSPEMMDRRLGLQNTMQFIGKAANAAQNASQLAGESQGVVRQAADIGLAVAEMFKPVNSADSHIFELPVVKTFSLNGSRACRNGQLIVSTTAAEAGVKEPQIIFFLLDARIVD